MKRFTLLALLAVCSLSAQSFTNGGITTVLGVNVCGADSGSANAYACTLPNVPSGVTFAYSAGVTYWFKPANNSTSTTPTLALNGLAAKTIKKQGGAGALVSGDLCTTQWAGVTYESVADKFLLQTPTCNAAAGGAAYATIDANGTGLTQRTTLNVIGQGITAVDNSGASTTEIRTFDLATRAGPICDDFITGLATSGNTGMWEWFVNVSSTGAVQSFTPVAGHPGAVQLATGGTQSAKASIVASNVVQFDITAMVDAWGILQTTNTNGSSPTNATFRFGFEGVTTAADPPVNGIYVEAKDTDSDWFFVTMGSSTPDTRVDTGVAISNNWPKFEIKHLVCSGASCATENTWGISTNGGGFRCITSAASVPAGCDGTAKTVNATHIPSVNLAGPFFFVINNAEAANKDLNVDAACYAIEGLSR